VSLKRALLAAAVLVLLGGGALLGYVLYVKHSSGDVRGSPTVEFTPQLPPPTPPPRRVSKKRTLTRVDWPLYGYDPRRLRWVPSRLRPPFRTVWTFRARKLLEFPPVIAYGRLYVVNNSGTLFSISAATGRAQWRYRSHRCSAASPAVAHEVVYAAFLNTPPCNSKRRDADGRVIAFDARKGRVLWQARIGPSESSPLVANGLVYAGDWRGMVYALSATTGRIVWSFRTGDKVKGAATLSGRRLYVGSYDHHVYALDARTGRLIWKASPQDRLGGLGTFYSTPAAAYDRVYIGSTDGKIYSFGASTGKLRWSQSTGGYVYASPAVWRGLILVGSYSGRFYAFDAATGDARWQFRANGPISGSAVVLGGLVYFSTLKGRTYALDPRTGRLVWSYPDGEYAGVVADPARAYLVGHTRLYALVPRR
jgi:outer membrane protein assembly factor BamB